MSDRSPGLFGCRGEHVLRAKAPHRDRTRQTEGELQGAQTSQSKQLARKLLADSASARWRQDDHELSVLLALQADKATRRAERDPALEANVGDTLRGAQVRPFTLSPPLDERRGLRPGRRPFSPDGKAIAVESDGNRVDIDLGSEPSCRRPTLK
jgi:hypothetical protein